MCKDIPVAIATVCFDAPLTGQQIAGLVQQVVAKNSSRFVVEERYHDGDLITLGQKSGYEYDHICVMTSYKDQPFFDLKKVYHDVKVTSYAWGGAAYGGSDDQLAIKTVKKFASDLAACYRLALDEGFPEFVIPEVYQLR